jgi:hypothetical protein
MPISISFFRENLYYWRSNQWLDGSDSGRAELFKDIRVLTSVLLILVILQSTGCTVSIQIGGKKNSVEQNRQSPTAQSEVTTTSQPPSQISEQGVIAEQEKKQAEEQRIAEQQKLAEEQRIASERAEEERRQAGERQHAEQLRIETENYYAEQQRRAQEQGFLEQARRAEEQRLAEVQRRRQAEEQRLAEIQRQADAPVMLNQTPPQQVIVVYPSRRPVPIRSTYTSTNVSGNIESSKRKGLSTKKKILIGSAIAGGTALGFWLGRRR